MSEIVINGIIDDSSEMQGKMKYAIGAPGPQGPQGDPALTYKSHWTVIEEPSIGSQEPMSIGNSFNRTPIVDDDFILVCDGQQSVAGRSWITNNKVTGVYSTYISYTCISVTETTGRAAISASGILKGDGQGNVSSAVPGTDYQTPLTTEEAETLGIDATPTANSNNLVKSGGVKSYVDTAVSTVLGITVSELANLLGGDA